MRVELTDIQPNIPLQDAINILSTQENVSIYLEQEGYKNFRSDIFDSINDDRVGVFPIGRAVTCPVAQYLQYMTGKEVSCGPSDTHYMRESWTNTIRFPGTSISEAILANDTRLD